VRGGVGGGAIASRKATGVVTAYALYMRVGTLTTSRRRMRVGRRTGSTPADGAGDATRQV